MCCEEGRGSRCGGGVAYSNNITQAQLINIHAAAIKLFFPIIHSLSYEHNGQSAEIKPQWANKINEELKRCSEKTKTKRGLIPRGEGGEKDGAGGEGGRGGLELICDSLDQEY